MQPANEAPLCLQRARFTRSSISDLVTATRFTTTRYARCGANREYCDVQLT